VFPSGEDITPAWRWCYEFSYPLLGELPKEKVLGNGLRVAATDSLNKHPIWSWLRKYMLRAAAEIGGTGTKKWNGKLRLSGESDPSRWHSLALAISRVEAGLYPFSLHHSCSSPTGVEWNPARDAPTLPFGRLLGLAFRLDGSVFEPVIQPGGGHYDYIYPMLDAGFFSATANPTDRPSTLWYHDHIVDFTAPKRLSRAGRLFPRV
jgi:hypothetical protein